jgi:hypothetical protein
MVGWGAIPPRTRRLCTHGGPEYRLAERIATRPFEAAAVGHQPVVRQIVVSGEGNGGAQGGLVTGLIASLLPALRDRNALPPASAA